jgi:hypothetical protein
LWRLAPIKKMGRQPPKSEREPNDYNLCIVPWKRQLRKS